MLKLCMHGSGFFYSERQLSMRVDNRMKRGGSGGAARSCCRPTTFGDRWQFIWRSQYSLVQCFNAGARLDPQAAAHRERDTAACAEVYEESSGRTWCLKS